MTTKLTTIALEFNLPDWSSFTAMDYDGTIAVFQFEPTPDRVAGRWQVQRGLTLKLGKLAEVQPDWLMSLSYVGEPQP